MARFVPDSMSKRWVIISPGRVHRPDDNSKTEAPRICPFCPGNEHATNPEVFRMGEGSKDEPGWKVRVIPNKYPITDFHEVIIHTPDDVKDISSLPLEDVELIFKAYKERYNFYKDRGHVLIFCNHGEHAGASIKHSHSQLVVVPGQISLDLIDREPVKNVVQENNYFHVYCPEFSQWPYEVWIAPKELDKNFGEISEEEVKELSKIVQITLQRLERIYHKGEKWLTVDFGYNFYIYHGDSWYLRVIPRFIHRAGFELGTGLSVNVIDPEKAAQDLRETEGEVATVLDKLKKY